jgi:hypothetical protein
VLSTKAVDDLSLLHVQTLNIADDYTGKSVRYLVQAENEYLSHLRDLSMYIFLHFF